MNSNDDTKPRIVEPTEVENPSNENIEEQQEQKNSDVPGSEFDSTQENIVKNLVSTEDQIDISEKSAHNVQDPEDLNKGLKLTASELFDDDDEILTLLREIEVQNGKVEAMKTRLSAMWEAEIKTQSEVDILKDLQSTVVQESLKLKSLIEQALEIQKLNSKKPQNTPSDNTIDK